MDIENLKRLADAAMEPIPVHALEIEELHRRQEARDEIWEEFVEMATSAIPELLAEREKLVEALRPFAEFGKYLIEHPRKGLAEKLYGWDNEIFIRQSDLNKAHAALSGEGHKAAQPVAASPMKNLPYGIVQTGITIGDVPVADAGAEIRKARIEEAEWYENFLVEHTRLHSESECMAVMSGKLCERHIRLASLRGDGPSHR